MSNETKHTATPWHTNGPDKSVVCAGNGMHRVAIADVYGPGDHDLDEAQMLAENNATYIVRAVNAHEALVAAIKEYLTS